MSIARDFIIKNNKFKKQEVMNTPIYLNNQNHHDSHLYVNR